MPIDTNKNVQWAIADWQGDVFYVWNLPITATPEEVKAAATEEYGLHTWASPYLVKPTISPRDLAELTKPEEPAKLREIVANAIAADILNTEDGAGSDLHLAEVYEESVWLTVEGNLDVAALTSTVLITIKANLLDRLAKGGKPASMIIAEELS